KNKKKIVLTTMELNILKYFAQREGQVVTREMLLDDVWGFENFPTTRTVDNYILSLRKKIEETPARPKHLITLHKAGYKFVK
ncbi:MAG TPA: helix-turn-helix domain-containing protein, partial [Bacteroidota bacterium]|nr:helix-turn-helix domain-containing protein [Bacteroidota bacterium]